MSLDFDVFIIGKGPVALSMASLLKHLVPWSKIALFNLEVKEKDFSPSEDPRILAINYGSHQILNNIKIDPPANGIIKNVHVSQKNYFGCTYIRNKDFSIPMLGYTINYDKLIRTLNKNISQKNISTFPYISPEEVNDLEDKVMIKIGNSSATARLAIIADGHPKDYEEYKYDQHAVLMDIDMSHSRNNWAYERFCPEGPIAFLPHPEIYGKYSLVWCCQSEIAKNLFALEKKQFSEKLIENFGERLGYVKNIGKKSLFPLSLKIRKNIIDKKTVAIGNSAQFLHPVAGQGFNLGLRDAFQLAMILRPYMSTELRDKKNDFSMESLLNKYQKSREMDKWITIGITNFLPRVFSKKFSMVGFLCNSGLLVMNYSRQIRNSFSRKLLYGTRKIY